jgi:hypothetical protein
MSMQTVNDGSISNMTTLNSYERRCPLCTGSTTPSKKYDVGDLSSSGTYTMHQIPCDARSLPIRLCSRAHLPVCCTILNICVRPTSLGLACVIHAKYGHRVFEGDILIFTELLHSLSANIRMLHQILKHLTADRDRQALMP